MRRLKPGLIGSVLALCLAGSFSGATVLAEERATASERSTELNFDDEVVESLNKNPMDSLQSIGRKNDSDHPRLYRKKTDFRREMKRTVGELEYLQ